MISGGTTVFGGSQWFAAVYDERQLVGCAIHAEPDGLILSRMPHPIIELVLENFARQNIPLSRLIFDSAISSQISTTIDKIGTFNLQPDMVWNILLADKVVARDFIADGALRPARLTDLDEVRYWGRLYSEEFPAVVEIDEFFTRKLKKRELFVWDDEGPKAVWTVSAETRNGICISAIYTAKQFRRKG